MLTSVAMGPWAPGVIREMLQEGHDPEVSSFAALAVAAAQDGSRSHDGSKLRNHL